MKSKRSATCGDGLVYPVLTQGYEGLAKKNGYSQMFRSEYVDNWGLCTFSSGEWLAAIDTMMQRLDTGVWPKTDPASLNVRAKELHAGGKARFFDFQGVKKFNREWVPTLEDYLGRK